MQGRKSKITIKLDAPTRAELEGLLRKQKTPVGVARRARAMLLLADGHTFGQTAEKTGLADRHVRKWAKRFVEQGVNGLYDQSRPGRPPVFSPSGSHVCREVGL